MEAPNINFFAIFLSACLSFVLGIIWYSPRVFGKVAGALGPGVQHSKEKFDEKKMATTLTLVFLGWILCSFGIDWLSGYLRVVTWDNGLVMGLWLAVCFVFPFSLHYYVMEKEPQAKVYAIHAGFLGFVVTSMSVLLSLL